ncbi:MAG: PucR family transcriptional regulator [Velocimicrobium sp.]
MNIETLIESKSDTNKYINVEISTDIQISACSLISEGRTDYEQDVLYFGAISQILNQEKQPQNIVWWQEQDTVSDPADKSLYDRILSTNWIQIAKSDWLDIYNQLNDRCMRRLKNENDYAQMIQMTLQGNPLSAILDFAFAKLKNEIVVIDVSGKLLGHTSTFEIPDVLWMTSIQKGYCSYEFMEHIKSERFKKQRPVTDVAFLSECYQDHLIYLSSKIILDGQLVGYVFMIQNREPFNQNCFEMLPYVSRSAGYHIKYRYGGKAEPFHIYDSVLTDVLAGMSPRHIAARIQIGEIKFPDRMCVIVIKPAYYRSEREIKKDLTHQLITLFKSVPYVYYEGSLVFIVPVDGTLKLPNKSRQALVQLAQREHLKIGKSNGFTEVLHLKQYYEEACEALKVAKEFNFNADFIDFQSVVFYSLLNELPAETNLMKYVHPALRLLKQYDDANGAHLYETLKVYAKTGFNQKETAEQMFLHRNTLNYRMKRIDEIAGLDLKNPEILFHLMLAYLIDDYLNSKSNP